MARRSSKKTLSGREQLRVIGEVAKLSFKLAPVAVVFKFVGATLNAILPFVTAYFAALTTTSLAQAYSGDTAASSRVITYVFITISLGLFTSFWHSIDNYVQAKMRFIIDTKVSTELYRHFLSLEFWRYDDKETVDMYERARNFTQFFSWIFDRMSTIFSQLIVVVSGVVALIAVTPWLALAIFIAVLPSIYTQFQLSRLQIAHWNDNVEVRRKANLIEWRLSQAKSIIELRLYGLVSYLLDLRRDLRDKDEKARIEFEGRFLGRRFLSDLLEATVQVFALVWVTLEIVATRQPVGQFIFVQQVISRVQTAVASFVSALSSIDEDVANLFDYKQFMDLPEKPGQGQPLKKAPEKIELKNVRFHYPQTENDVVKGISFTLMRGQHIAIVGENGAGKSTLVKLISGLYEPTAGCIELDGRPLRDFNIVDWHACISVLSQDINEYDFATARENIMFGDVSKKDDTLYEQALHSAQAWDFIQKLPSGDKTYLNNWMETEDGTKGIDLSGGQWQRVAMARNFYRDTPIIILDEPTSAIDALAESRIFKHLFEEKDKTIITVSHRLTTVEKADRIYMVEEGKVVETGTHKELVAKKGKYYTMFEAQIQK